ncbi:MAG: hypothetical protein PHW41_04665 [Eubacteriales bacterium]|nr:hypothetical protein [Eubacteriales bacterium]
MKSVKRLIALVLLCALLFALSACTAAGTNVLGVANATTPLDTASAGSAAQSDDAIAAGEVYRNEYFKFTCDLSDEWYVLNQDEIAQMLGRTYDALGSGKAGELIQNSFNNGETQMDFYAINVNTAQTTNIVLSKAKVLELLLSDQMLLKASIPLLTSGLTDMGATSVTSDTKQIRFLGKDRTALVVQAEYQGGQIQETIFVIRQGGYLASITFTDLSKTPSMDYVDSFQVID